MDHPAPAAMPVCDCSLSGARVIRPYDGAGQPGRPSSYLQPHGQVLVGWCYRSRGCTKGGPPTLRSDQDHTLQGPTTTTDDAPPAHNLTSKRVRGRRETTLQYPSPPLGRLARRMDRVLTAMPPPQRHGRCHHSSITSHCREQLLTG
jgi:hypothetical protein